MRSERPGQVAVMSGDENLVSSEGVDEGSAASTVEDADSGSSQVQGAAPQGAPADSAQQARPDDMESEESRASRDAAGTGQQLQAGEG